MTPPVIMCNPLVQSCPDFPLDNHLAASDSNQKYGFVDKPGELRPIFSQNGWVSFCGRRFGDNGKRVANEVFYFLQKRDKNPYDGYLNLSDLTKDDLKFVFDRLRGVDDESKNAISEISSFLNRYCRGSNLKQYVVGKLSDGKTVIGVDAVSKMVVGVWNRKIIENLKPGETAKLVMEQRFFEGHHPDELNASRTWMLLPRSYSKGFLVKSDGFVEIDSQGGVELRPYSNSTDASKWKYLVEAIDEGAMIFSGLLTILAAARGGRGNTANPLPVVQVGSTQIPIRSPELPIGLLEALEARKQELDLARVVENSQPQTSDIVPVPVPENVVPVVHESGSAVSSPVAVEPVPPVIAVRPPAIIIPNPQQLSVFGQPIQTYLDALAAYRSLTPEGRVAEAINRAYGIGAIERPDARELTMSPFGWHLTEFFALLNTPSFPFRDPSSPLEIACYGAGFHNDLALMEAVSVEVFGQSLGRRGYPLHTAQQFLFGAAMATSYEPRELLALFLSGSREGGVHVFDNYPPIAADLARPTFSYLDAMRAYYRNPPTKMEMIDDYWWDAVAVGRDVETKRFGVGPTGEPIESHSFRFTPEEMAKMHVHPLDIASDSLDVGRKFDLSTWFEGWYFFPPPILNIVWAKIIANTEIGGYIVTDMPLQLTPDYLRSLGFDMLIPMRNQLKDMGLEYVGTIQGQLYTKGNVSYRPVFKKVCNTDEVSVLANLNVD